LGATIALSHPASATVSKTPTIAEEEKVFRKFDPSAMDLLNNAARALRFEPPA
jgi:hypothetical protein